MCYVNVPCIFLSSGIFDNGNSNSKGKIQVGTGDANHYMPNRTFRISGCWPQTYPEFFFLPKYLLMDCGQKDPDS